MSLEAREAGRSSNFRRVQGWQVQILADELSAPAPSKYLSRPLPTWPAAHGQPPEVKPGRPGEIYPSSFQQEEYYGPVQGLAGTFGSPKSGHVVGLLKNSGRRFLANHGDEKTLRRLASMEKESVGLKGHVSNSKDGRNLFSLYHDAGL